MSDNSWPENDQNLATMKKQALCFGYRFHRYLHMSINQIYTRSSGAFSPCLAVETADC